MRTRATVRLAIGGVFLLVSLALVFFAFLPIISKSELPIMWVHYAHQFGWTKEMQHIGLQLLANGRIEVLPSWVSYLCLLIAMILMWVGIQLIRFRYEQKKLGDALTFSYWMNFYWIKKPVDHVKVQYRNIKK